MEKAFKSFTINTELLEVKYSSLPKVSGDLGVVIEDTAKIENEKNNAIELIYIRKIDLEPKASFQIEIKYLVMLILVEDSKKDINAENYQYVLDFLSSQENIAKVINKSKVAGRTAALISSITTYNNFNPLITPPIYLGKKTE